VVPGLDALAATAAATFAVGGPPPNLSELLSNRGRRAVALIKPPLPLITDKPDANAGCGRSLAWPARQTIRSGNVATRRQNTGPGRVDCPSRGKSSDGG
jgi:hypothetical protein